MVVGTDSAQKSVNKTVDAIVFAVDLATGVAGSVKLAGNVLKNGYTTYVSKDRKYVARYGYKKDGLLELNLENDLGGNFHIEVQ